MQQMHQTSVSVPSVAILYVVIVSNCLVYVYEYITVFTVICSIIHHTASVEGIESKIN